MCTFDALSPNDVLYVCIESTSSDILVDNLFMMDITQGDDFFPVIESGEIMFPSLTSRDYDDIVNGVRVATLVPQNIFSFATGNNITVSGAVDTKLAGSGRKTRALVGVDDVPVDGTEEGAYELQVALVEDTVVSSDGGLPMIS